MEKLRNQWIAGAGAGCIESIITMPFEVMKTKLQVGSKSWKEALYFDSANRSILRSSYAGLTPILLQTSMKVGIRFSAFEGLKPIAGNNLAGFLAGAFEAFIWVAPTERLKVLFITSGGEHRDLWNSTRKLLRNQGITGLWRGGTATVLRNSLTVGTRFSVYEKLLQFFNDISRNSFNVALAGFISGAITTAMFQPLDCIKTRMGADCVLNEKPKFKTNFECAKMIWQQSGFRGFLSGLSARMIKIPLGQTIIFYTQDRIYKYL